MLPYQTLEEATVSLGRNLTLAEALWFKYSARKSDYILYWHTTLFLFIFFTLMPLPYVILELMDSEKIDKYKIQANVKHSLADMWDCYKKVIYKYFIAGAPIHILSHFMMEKIGIRTSLPLPSGSEIFWQLLVSFVIEDYALYWLHRMLHQKWAYEKIHRIHHEYAAPIGFATAHSHWVEFITLGLPSFLGPVIVPGHIITFWLWTIFRQWQAIEVHSGYDFPWNPSKYIPFYGGSVFHDYHHFVGEKSQSNFGSIFTYCDYIYGTNKGFRYMKEFVKTREKFKQK